MPQHSLIPITYRPPFAVSQEPWRDVREHGQTILEIVKSVPNLPEGFINRGGVVCINGEIVPRSLWALVKPKATSEAFAISVTLHWPLQSPGGGSSGGNTTKSIIGLVAAIALIAVTGFLAAPAGVAFLGGFGITGFAATALTAAVGIGGALAISALTAPPTAQPAAQIASDTNQDNKDPAGAGGNTIAPGGSIPRVVGTRKVFPPLICEPVVELVNTEDEVVEAVFGLNGPHALSDYKIDGVSISDAPSGISIDTRDGQVGSSALTLVTRQGRTTQLQVTMSQHKLSSDDLNLLTQTAPDLPIFHRFTTFDTPDEIWIHLLFPGGATNTVANGVTEIPFRMRFRLVGSSTWINFPEFHFSHSSGKPMRRQIKILFSAAPSSNFVGSIPVGLFNWGYARFSPPQQSSTPNSASTNTTWTANSYFGGGSGGNDYVMSGFEGSTKINNMSMTQDSVLFWVGSAGGATPGRYEIELVRGCGFLQANFSASAYTYSGNVRDFFGAIQVAGSYQTPQNQSGFVSTSALVRCVSIWNQAPVSSAAQNKFALIAIKATNRQINRVSCLASGMVNTWNGFSWVFSTAGSSNPADHYRDVLMGAQNHDPIDINVLDDTQIKAWRAICASRGWQCHAIIDDMRTQDALALIASCGYAKPYQSDNYSVVIDNDRSSDPPIQVFSRVNTIGMKYDKAFARVPSGLIITYHSSSKDYENDQYIVNQTDPSVGVTGLYEAITYDGLVTQAQVAARGKFDLDQTNLRSTFYSFEADIESLVCRRGSLVAIQHDILSDRAADARVRTVLTSGGNLTGLVLDAKITVVSGSTGIGIRHSDGTITTHAISNASGDTDTLTLTTPYLISPVGSIVGFDDTNDQYGCLVVSGILGTEYKRMLVFSVTPTKDLRANVVLVDEAQALVRF